MIASRQNRRLLLLTSAVMAASAVLAGCGSMEKSSSMVALTTQMRGGNEVPAVNSPATGQVDAVFDKQTSLLRWKISYSGLTGPATAGHFHGPAAIGANAGVVLPWAGTVTSPMEGSATLTPAQAEDLLAGRWYANIHTATHKGGEIRGQMTVVN